MKTWLLPTLCLLLAACVNTPNPQLAAAPHGAYTLDKKHASLILRLAHAKGLSQFTARFDDIDAALDFDPQRPQDSRLSVVIAAKSIDTGMPGFDKKLAATRNLLDAAAHPQILFTSTAITATGASDGQVTGLLTLRGVTHPVTLTVHYNGSAYDMLRGTQVLGFSATGAFSRAAFGADAWSSLGVGDKISIHIEAEFLKT